MFEHNQVGVNRLQPVRPSGGPGLIIGSMLTHMGLVPFALVRVGLAGWLAGVCLAGVSATTIAGQTPAASLPATYATGAELMTALKNATEGNPDMSTAAVKNTDQYRI